MLWAGWGLRGIDFITLTDKGEISHPLKKSEAVEKQNAMVVEISEKKDGREPLKKSEVVEKQNAMVVEISEKK
ncbi:hypothetical protein KY290_036881 [Solanum tuberosum]|uniref:Uncharacterized protein n=1 Tax=Solanum tuberosum TaxID=4113 RepID=A0ABQ7TTY6_SOLTU|nr:hypothetical protein KY284_036236 [Solanum tuberosum]KAH0636444.1 hypothetical protein KY289_036359 [Solanum tuberosum]KAH0738176.1 hypothetical protein KY290_036881 [Solanum tuberosum]